MIDHVTGWCEIVQYDGNIGIYIEKLVETTWLSRYTTPIYITNDQVSELIGHEFINS